MDTPTGAPQKASQADLATPQGCVDAGVEAYATAELKLRQAQKAILDIIPIIKAGNSLGMMGNLQTQRMVAALKGAAGFAAHAEEIVWISHAEGTEIAVKNNVDPPHTEGGGPR